MFCQNCGTPLEDNAAFCTNCGAPTSNADPAAQPAEQTVQQTVQQPVAAPVAPSAPNPALKGFGDLIKIAFKADGKKLAEAAAEASGTAWILFAVISIVTYALSQAINYAQYYSFAYYGFLNFFLTFFKCILIGGVAFAVAGIGGWLIAKVGGKTDKNILTGLNIAGAASIPLTLVCALNIILGFTGLTIPGVLIEIATVIALVICYLGIKAISKKELHFLAFIIYVAGVLVTVAIFKALFGAIFSVSNSLLNIYNYL